MNTTIGIFEPLYELNQSLSEPAFLPLVRETNLRPEWREFQILIDIYRAGKYLEHDYTGVFSPKFNLKCKISGKQFLEFVHAQAGKDVYFINPFPQIPYYSFNVWMEGEYAHRGIGSATQGLLDACGLDVDISSTPRHGPDVLAYANFWVGSREFWRQYVGGLLIPIAEFLENNPTHPATVCVMQETTHTDPAPYLPFIIERLFSTYLSAHPESKIGAYQIDGEEILNYCVSDYERLLYKNMVSQVQSAEASGLFSPELISQMDMLSALRQQHIFELFSVKPHPHSCKPIAWADGL